MFLTQSILRNHTPNAAFLLQLCLTFSHCDYTGAHVSDSHNITSLQSHHFLSLYLGIYYSVTEGLNNLSHFNKPTCILWVTLKPKYRGSLVLGIFTACRYSFHHHSFSSHSSTAQVLSFTPANFKFDVPLHKIFLQHSRLCWSCSLPVVYIIQK